MEYICKIDMYCTGHEVISSRPFEATIPDDLRSILAAPQKYSYSYGQRMYVPFHLLALLPLTNL